MQIRKQLFPYYDLKAIIDNIYDLARKAFGVRGRDNSGNSERLATQADQTTGNGYLSNIQGYTANIPALSSPIVRNLYLSTDGKGSGVNMAGSAFVEDNKDSARLKFQTQNVQKYEVTERAPTYNIDKTTDFKSFPFAEINQISISGFNLSIDTALQFKFYFWNALINTYEAFYDYVVGYGSPNYNAENQNIKFFPNVVGDWNEDDSRYGYFEIISLGTATAPNHIFFVDITVTPFSKNS